MLAWLPFLILFALPPAVAGQAFEGVIRTRGVILYPDQVSALMKIDPGTRPDPERLFDLSLEQLSAVGARANESATSFKGRRVRVDRPTTYTLIDSAGGPITLVNPGMGRAARLSRETMDIVAGVASRPDEAEGRPVSIRELGATTINGVETVGFEATDGESVYRGWIAPSRRVAAAAMNSVYPMMTAALAPRAGFTPLLPPFDAGLLVRSQYLFPARPDSPGGPGWRYAWYELASIDPPPDDSVFTVPAGMPVRTMIDPRPFAFEGLVRQRLTVLGPEQIASLTGSALGSRPDPERLFGAASADLIAGARASTESTISFKRAQIRIDPPSSAAAAGSYILIDVGSGQMRVVVPGIERVLIVPQAFVQRLLGELAGGTASAASEADARVRELGPATVDGLATTAFEATSGQSITRAWLAPRHEAAGAAMTLLREALPDVLAPTQATSGLPADRGLAIRSGTLAPVPEGLVATLGQGWTFTTIEVTAVEERPLDAALFDMPPGFEIVEMPDFR